MSANAVEETSARKARFYNSMEAAFSAVMSSLVHRRIHSLTDSLPTVLNPTCQNSGILVPDKKLREWKPTNLKGYKALFEKRASLRAKLRMLKTFAAEERANVERFPVQSGARKGDKLEDGNQEAQNYQEKPS